MELKIFLRDINQKIVKAWEAVFINYPDVKISCGNIFDLEADAIISPANSFGFMDGGIDLIYTQYFGENLQKKLQQIIYDDFYGEIPVGAAKIVETSAEKIKYLISAPTMRVPDDVSNTVNAYLAFRASLIEIIKFNKESDEKILSVLCPGLGTLTGGIQPAACAIQMKYAYDSILGNKKSFPNNLNDEYLNNAYLRQEKLSL